MFKCDDQMCQSNVMFKCDDQMCQSNVMVKVNIQSRHPHQNKGRANVMNGLRALSTTRIAKDHPKHHLGFFGVLFIEMEGSELFIIIC